MVAGASPPSSHVSVVLPTYNRASVLGDAIESVLGQSHDDLELIVVDDGDDDATPAIVSSFDDDRLMYVRRDESVSEDDGGGVSSARNAGVRRTDGDLIAFIDSDDRWHPDKIRQQIAALRDARERGGAACRDCGVVYTTVTKDEGEPRTRDGASGNVAEAIRHLDVPTYTSTLLIRRTAFEQVGGFDEQLCCFEDWDLCLRLARDWEFEYVNTPLVLKGTDSENISANPDRLAHALDRLFDRHDLPDEARAQFLADAGTTYCEAGQLAAGRPYLRRALELDFRPNATIALVFSLSGSSQVFDAGMGAVYAVKRRFAE